MKRELEIKIKVTFGSDFQEKTWEEMIDRALHSAQEMIEMAHKGNTFDYNFFTK